MDGGAPFEPNPACDWGVDGGAPFEPNPACDWGVEHEPVAVEAYTHRTGLPVDDTGFHVHPEYDWIGASPDGLVGPKGLLEVKCPFYSDHPHIKVPVGYYVQMQIQMECTDRDWCDFCSWTPNGCAIYRVARDVDCFPLLLAHLLPIYGQMRRGEEAIKKMAYGAREALVPAKEWGFAEDTVMTRRSSQWQMSNTFLYLTFKTEDMEPAMAQLRILFNTGYASPTLKLAYHKENQHTPAYVSATPGIIVWDGDDASGHLRFDHHCFGQESVAAVWGTPTNPELKDAAVVLDISAKH